MRSSLALAAVLLALQAQAQQPTAPPPPVRVDDCAFNSWTLSPTGATARIEVRYTVTAPVAADAIRFDILWGDGKVTTVEDAGRFAPGVPIKHVLDFSIVGETTGESLTRMDVSVDEAHLVDGARWSGPYRGGPPTACHVYRLSPGPRL